jgi:hypothetical protein
MTDSPNALAVWAAFALMIGYGYRLRLPVAVGSGLAIAFAAGSMLSWRGFAWKQFEQRPELLLPIAAIVFAIGLAPEAGSTRRFALIYRMVGLFVLLGALWALSTDAELSVLAWGETTVKALYQLCGFAASTAAIAIGVRREWPETTNIGAGSFVVFLYTKFYQWWWDWMPAYLFFFTVGVIAIAIIAVLRRVREGIATAGHDGTSAAAHVAGHRHEHRDAGIRAGQPDRRSGRDDDLDRARASDRAHFRSRQRAETAAGVVASVLVRAGRDELADARETRNARNHVPTADNTFDGDDGILRLGAPRFRRIRIRRPCVAEGRGGPSEQARRCAPKGAGRLSR